MMSELEQINLNGFSKIGKEVLFRAVILEGTIEEFVNNEQKTRILVSQQTPLGAECELPDKLELPKWVLTTNGYFTVLPISVINYSIIAGGSYQGLSYEFLPAVEDMIEQFMKLNPHLKLENPKGYFVLDTSAMKIYFLG